MHFRAAPVLQNRLVFESRDPDRTRAFMQRVEFYLDLHPREATAFDFATSALYLPNSYIGHVQYGSAVSIRVPADRKRDDYFVHLPARGASEVTNRAGSTVCAARQGVVSSPAGHLMRSEPSSARITVSLTKSAIMGQLGALLGESPMRPLEFFPTINLDSDDGQRIGRHVRLAIADLDDASGCSPIMLSMYEQLIMTSLLLCQPNNYSDALHRREMNTAPRDVQRAIDYMLSHLGLPVTLADIVAASGIPGRTLLKHFRDHYGMSPMRYLRNARLAQAREALLRTDGGQSVTQIAIRSGFDHLGRFAVEYRRLFGESPSETHTRKRRARLRHFS